MNKIEDLVKEIAPAKEERPKTYTAEVSHTDEEGIVWVRLPGAEQDTPTASTSSEVKMGDTVTVEWRNNKLYIAGNYTNPSAGVTRVAKAEQTAEKAVSDAETARAAAESAQETAAEAITIAGDTDQHFWFTKTGTDTGAHITEATQDDFLADPANGGANLLARSNGIAIRDGLSELATFAASGARIGQTSGRNITVDTNGLKVKDGSTVAASFGASSATIGKTSSKNIVVDSNGMTVKNGATTMASFTANGAAFSTSAKQNAVTIGTEAQGQDVLGKVSFGANGPWVEGMASGDDQSIEIITEGSGSSPYSIADITLRATNTDSGSLFQVVNNSAGMTVWNNTNSSEIAVEPNRAFISSNNIEMAGNVTATGTITAEGHSSPIGDIRTRGMESDTVVHTATGTALCALTLPAGTWSLVGFVRFPANNTGVRRANLSTDRASNALHVQTSPTQGGVTQLQVCNVVTVTATTTYYLNVYHTAGVDLTLPAGTSEGYINGIRAARNA